MTHHLIKLPNIDIYTLPEVDKNYLAKPETEIAIGDLHGNAIKLLFLLVKHGIASNISKEDYAKLVEIYFIKPTELTKEHLELFKTIMAKIEFNKSGKILLVGDVLADRGSNDYLTLLLLKRLGEKEVPVEVLLSNHDIEFIESYETKQDFFPPRLGWDHADSLKNLKSLIDRNLVQKSEMIEMINACYKPGLKAISYLLSEDEKQITIYSHAAIGTNTISYIAKKLTVPYFDKTPAELAKTIDAINEKFQEHVKNNTVHTLYKSSIIVKYYNGNSSSQEDDPFEFLMWNRSNLEETGITRNSKDYIKFFVHGHDLRDQTKDNVYNLDNNLGKGLNRKVETYTALYSNKKPELNNHPYVEAIIKEQQEKEKKIRKKEKKEHRKALKLLINSLDQPIAQNNYEEVERLINEFKPSSILNEIFQHLNTQGPNQKNMHQGWPELLGHSSTTNIKYFADFQTRLKIIKRLTQLICQENAKAIALSYSVFSNALLSQRHISIKNKLTLLKSARDELCELKEKSEGTAAIKETIKEIDLIIEKLNNPLKLIEKPQEGQTQPLKSDTSDLQIRFYQALEKANIEHVAEIINGYHETELFKSGDLIVACYDIRDIKGFEDYLAILNYLNQKKPEDEEVAENLIAAYFFLTRTFILCPLKLEGEEKAEFIQKAIDCVKAIVLQYPNNENEDYLCDMITFSKLSPQDGGKLLFLREHTSHFNSLYGALDKKDLLKLQALLEKNKEIFFRLGPLVNDLRNQSEFFGETITCKNEEDFREHLAIQNFLTQQTFFGNRCYNIMPLAYSKFVNALAENKEIPNHTKIEMIDKAINSVMNLVPKCDDSKKESIEAIIREMQRTSEHLESKTIEIETDTLQNNDILQENASNNAIQEESFHQPANKYLIHYLEKYSEFVKQLSNNGEFDDEGKQFIDNLASDHIAHLKATADVQAIVADTITRFSAQASAVGDPHRLFSPTTIRKRKEEITNNEGNSLNKT